MADAVDSVVKARDVVERITAVYAGVQAMTGDG
jgi:hypothetical protein